MTVPLPTPLLAAAVVLACAALGACSTAPPRDPGEASRASRRAALHRAESFATVLSERADLAGLRAFDVVILDPDPYTASDIASLRAAGVTTLGYVNLGEVEAWRSFAGRVEAGWVLGDNPAWPGHQFVDAREPGWRRLVVETVAPVVASKEFDGLFLDMVDVASPALFPETEDGVVALVDALREAYPAHALVMNRGLFLLDRVEPALDGLLVEGVWARLDLETGSYVPTAPGESSRLLTALRRVQDGGGGAFAIEYADSDPLRALVRDSAQRAGLPVYVGERALGAADPPARSGW